MERSNIAERYKKDKIYFESALLLKGQIAHNPPPAYFQNFILLRKTLQRGTLNRLSIVCLRESTTVKNFALSCLGYPREHTKSLPGEGLAGGRGKKILRTKIDK